MRNRSCRQLAELRSGYLDGALAEAERERVLTHLLGCPACRVDVEELRALRQLLGGIAATSSAGAPTELSARLVSIAGGDADVPVWCRPFRRTRPGALPRARRAFRLRVTAAALALGGTVAASGVLGYLAAPPDLAAVADPVDRARSEFASTRSELPLASRSLGAVMMTPATRLPSPAAGSLAPALTTSGQPLAAAAAVAALHRAVAEADQVRYAGVQQVSTAFGDAASSATVRIASEPGQGSAVAVLDRDGREALNRFVPASTSRTAHERLLFLLVHNYVISGWRGRVLGRPVTLVEAAHGPGRSSRPVARWWVDDATGLLLRQESYDALGNVALRAEFTELTISATPTFMEHLAPRLVTSATAASLALSDVAELTGRGWYCSDDLAGMSLVRMRGDDLNAPGTLHLLYSDGISTLSVFEQRGHLSGPPADARWDPSLQAFVNPGTPAVATWPSADTVFTAVTEGPPELLSAAVRALPHDPWATPTTMDRVQAGWSRIRKLVIG